MTFATFKAKSMASISSARRMCRQMPHLCKGSGGISYEFSTRNFCWIEWYLSVFIGLRNPPAPLCKEGTPLFHWQFLNFSLSISISPIDETRDCRKLCSESTFWANPLESESLKTVWRRTILEESSPPSAWFPRQIRPWKFESQTPIE